jgi:hypothetical protein
MTRILKDISDAQVGSGAFAWDGTWSATAACASPWGVTAVAARCW